MALQLRRGTNAQRIVMTPLDGELIFVSDWEEAGVPALWIGNGSTPGGIVAASQRLNDIRDVTIAAVANNDLLAYNAAGEFWTNVNDITVDQLTATSITTGDLTSTGDLTAGTIFATVALDTNGDLQLQKDATTVGAGKIAFGRSTSKDTYLRFINNRFEFSKVVHGAGGFTAGSLEFAKTGLRTIRTNDALGINFEGTNPAGKLTTNLDAEFSGGLKVDGLIEFANNLAMTGADTNIEFFNPSNTKRGMKGQTGTNDLWFVGGGATGYDQGYAEISTTEADDEIYVRQYDGSLNGTVVREAVLLDSNGNTQLPGQLTAGAITANGVTTINDYLNVQNDITSNSLYATSAVQAGAFAAPVKAALSTDGLVPKIALTTADGTFQIDNNAGTDLISAYWSNGGGNRMQFSLTDQWFNSGKLGVNTAAPAYTLDVNGTARITGDLIVSGTTTTVNSETVLIADNIITLNSNVTGGSATENAGIEVERGTLTNAQLLWDEAAKRWKVSGTDIDFSLRNILVSNDNISAASLNVDSGVLYVDPLTNRVGINSTNPQYELQVEGTILAQAIIGLDTLGLNSNLIVVNNADLALGTELAGLKVKTGNSQHADVVWNDVASTWEFREDGVFTNLDCNDIHLYGQLFATDIIGLTTLALNGDYVITNNEDGVLTATSGLKVKRGSGNVAEAIWNEPTQEWLLLNNGSVANVNVNEVNSTAINIDERVRHNSVVKTTTSTTADQVVFVAPYKSVKLFVEVARAGEYQALEIIMLTNGTSAYMSQYGELITGSAETAPGSGIYIPEILATFSADYSGGLRLLVTPTLATETVITIATIAITS